jgi:glycolate oxidase iron-sulfur subunit
VETDLLFIAARKTLADHNGIPKIKQVVFSTLEKPGRVNLAVTAGSLAQKVFGRKAVNVLAGGMAVPPLRTRPLLRDLADVVEPVGRRRARVGLFVGCMANYVSDGPARASIEVLRRLGVEIVIPKRQVCCGAPAFNNGDFDTARRLARRNLDIFREADVDAIISPDATCGGAFRHEYPELLSSDKKYSGMAEELSLRSIDWSSFVLALDPTFPEKKQPPISVTVHDSCHLAHTAGTHGNVREVLRRLPGVTIVEMEESTVCCGFGGSFSSIYSGESERWQQRKIGHMAETRAQVAVAASPGCIATLRETIERGAGVNFRLLHPAELIVERCDWGE